MSLRMPHTLALLKLSDGTAAVDMQVPLVTEPFQSVVGEYTSFQIATPNGPVGTWSIEDSNDTTVSGGAPAYNGMWDPFPTAFMSSATQPAGGGAVVTTITAMATCAFRRAKWTPSSGGTGVLPTKIKAVRGGVL
jgi:hypothetical protein